MKLSSLVDIRCFDYLPLRFFWDEVLWLVFTHIIYRQACVLPSSTLRTYWFKDGGQPLRALNRLRMQMLNSQHDQT